MAKSGKKVLVLEQHDQAGGCCHTFIEKGTTNQSTYFSFTKALTFHLQRHLLFTNSLASFSDLTILIISR